MRRALGVLLLPFLMAAAPPQGDPAARVTGVRLTPAAGNSELVIEVQGEIQSWTDFVLSGPTRLVIDITNAVNALPSGRYSGIARGGIEGVRASQFEPGVVRVVIDLAAQAPYTVARVPGGLSIQITTDAGSFQAWSSAGPVQQAPAPTPAAPDPGPGWQTAPLIQEQPRITVNFTQTDIRDVLATFAEFTDRSIVPGSGVEGSVTASIRNQPWDVALQTILRAYGLAAEEMPSGIIQVDDIEALQARQTGDPLITRAFRANYVPADELAVSLESLLTERGRISSNATTNTLLVTDVESVIDDLASMMGELDVRTPQVSIQAKIIFVNRTDVEEFGITYDLKDSRGSSLNRLTSVPDPNNAGSFTDQDLVLLGGNSIAGLGNANVRVQGPQLELVTSLLLGRYTLVSFIDALQSAELSDVQAAPVITTLDNQQAEIWVGEETPIRVVDVGGAGGAGGAGGLAAPRATAQLVETGIRLRVTPHITGDRRILMDIHAERSGAILAATDIGVSFQRQQATNRVMVEDGETAVIAGLTVTEVTNTRAGIPFLMDLPFVGWLFRTERSREQQRDLLIMVTPRIVEDRG
jgi:type IV pilus assembly protein PilQ